MLHSDGSWPHMLHDIDLREIFKSANLKFTVSGQSKQASIDKHTREQCSHTSVGLAQARPNKGCTYLLVLQRIKRVIHAHLLAGLLQWLPP